MTKVRYQVPLNKLYKVVASCMYEEYASFCPVLIKIVDEQILNANKMKPYLLQVYTGMGEMIYEKSLARPVANWNISADKFVFLEDASSTEIHLVKLFKDKEPVLFKFILPERMTEGKVMCAYDSDT